MCEMASWVELQSGRIKFLTKECLETKRGAALIKHVGNLDDLKGHGAIRWYFRLENYEGTNRECTDFSTPENFPDEIVRAIKAGQMEGIGIAEGLLTGPAWAEYEKVTGPALAEYEKVTGPALAEYEKVRGPALAEYEKVRGQAWAEYKKVRGQAWAEYEKVRGQAWAEYEKVRGQAWAEYEKVRGQAWAEYEKVTGPALAEYEKVTGQAFWQIFANPDNRIPAWR